MSGNIPLETCSKCGKEFFCGTRAGNEECWCMDYPPAKFKEALKSCLCPACFEAELRAEKSKVSPPVKKPDLKKSVRASRGKKA